MRANFSQTFFVCCIVAAFSLNASYAADFSIKVVDQDGNAVSDAAVETDPSLKHQSTSPLLTRSISVSSRWLSPFKKDSALTSQIKITFGTTYILFRLFGNFQLSSMLALGGHEGIERITENFIMEITGDDRVIDHFADSNVQRFREKFAEHLCMVVDGPCQYTRDTMIDINTARGAPKATLTL